MAEINIDKMAKDIAEIALDEIFYDGKTIRELMKIVVEADYIGKWIPVSERLPKAFQYVLVTYEAFHWSNEPATYDVKIISFSGVVDFIAWMPLPEPYKAESEE